MNAEIQKRIPELGLIENREIKESTILVLEEVPEEFWEWPASSSGAYHPADTIDEGGLVLHTRRVMSMFDMLADSYKEMDIITEEEADIGLMACALHDTYKYADDKYDESHDSVTARKLRGLRNTEATDKLEELEESWLDDKYGKVLECIARHNGPWGNISIPTNPVEHLVHISDMAVSRTNTYLLLDDEREFFSLSEAKKIRTEKVRENK